MSWMCYRPNRKSCQRTGRVDCPVILTSDNFISGERGSRLPKESDRLFADDTYKYISLSDKSSISIKFHSILFLTVSRVHSCNDSVPIANRRQAIARTNAHLACIYLP